MNSSAGYWRHYATLGLSNYNNPLWTNRVGIVDWKNNFQWTLYEITSNGGRIDLASMKPTSGGTILEAEDISNNASVIETKVSGFTGKGYSGKGVNTIAISPEDYVMLDHLNIIMN